MATLHELLDEYTLSLRANNLSPRTVADYTAAARGLADWLPDKHVDEITHRDIRRYLVELSERPHQRTGGRVSDSYVASHHRRLQQLFRWLEEEDEIDQTPFRRVKPWKVPPKPVPLIDDEAVRRLLKAATDKRDLALIRVLLDTGIRASELVSMQRDNPGLVYGKGRKMRTVYWSDATELALRRYLRTRTDDNPWLWHGKRGRLTTSGVRQILARTVRRADIEHIYPHMFRHLFSHNFLAAGGTEGDLMRLCGWSSPEMVRRYGASGAEKRAADAYKRLGVTSRY